MNKPMFRQQRNELLAASKKEQKKRKDGAKKKRKQPQEADGTTSPQAKYKRKRAKVPVIDSDFDYNNYVDEEDENVEEDGESNE